MAVPLAVASALTAVALAVASALTAVALAVASTAIRAATDPATLVSPDILPISVWRLAANSLLVISPESKFSMVVASA